jgi:LmeA-like phospholipid-binding
VSTFIAPIRAARPLRKRRLLWLGCGTAVMVAAGLAVLTVPIPGLEGYLDRLAIERVRTQVACPGVLPRPPTVAVNGRLASQLLRGTLSDVRVSVPDATLNGVPHAAFEATLRGVTQPAPDRTHAQTMTAAITVGFANLPAPAGTTYRRTLTVGSPSRSRCPPRMRRTSRPSST